MDTSKRSERVTAALALLFSALFLMASIGFLTDLGSMSEPETPLSGFNPTNPSNPIEQSSNQTTSSINGQAPLFPTPQEDATFSINFKDAVPDIVHALPSQTFDVDVSVTNDSSSVDSAYLKVQVELPTIDIDGNQELIFLYHAMEDWDISYTPRSDSLILTAIHRSPVRAGETIALFDSVTINSKLDREHVISLKDHRLAQLGENPCFNIRFNATGTQVTGFEGF